MHEVYAVRHGTHVTTHGSFYHGWSHYAEEDSPLPMDYYFWVLRDTETGGVTLFDCGFDGDVARRRSRSVVADPVDLLVSLGVGPDDVSRLIVSHCHYDHIGTLARFPRARVTIAAAELRFWTESPIARRPQFARHTDPDALDVLRALHGEGRVDTFDEEAILHEDIRVLRVGGHTPGQSILLVRGAEGEVLLASDAVHYYEELHKDRPTAVHADLEATYVAFDRIRELCRGGFRLVPGHDPQVLRTFPKGPTPSICRVA